MMFQLRNFKYTKREDASDGRLRQAEARSITGPSEVASGVSGVIRSYTQRGVELDWNWIEIGWRNRLAKDGT